MTILKVLVGTLVVMVAIRWCWIQFWNLWHKRIGLADIKQISHWGPEEFGGWYKYLRIRFDVATTENQKRERSLDTIAMVDVARQHGFVLRREGESFDTLHFAKAPKKEEVADPVSRQVNDGV